MTRRVNSLKLRVVGWGCGVIIGAFAPSALAAETEVETASEKEQSADPTETNPAAETVESEEKKGAEPEAAGAEERPADDSEAESESDSEPPRPSKMDESAPAAIKEAADEPDGVSDDDAEKEAATPRAKEQTTQETAHEVESGATVSDPGDDWEGGVWIPRLAFAVGGFTRLDAKCDAEGGLSCGDVEETGHGEASGVAFGLDGLYGVSSALRIGAGLSFIPGVKGDAGSELRHLGSEVSAVAILETVIPVHKSVAVSLRVQGGAAGLIPAGFVDEQVKQAENDCDDAASMGIDCRTEQPAPIGATYGGGLGLIWPLEDLKLRLDSTVQTQRLPIIVQEASSGGDDLKATTLLDQTRFWIGVGLEI